MKKYGILILTLILLTGCCAKNNYKDDIIEKNEEELSIYLGDYKVVDRASGEDDYCDESNKHDYYTVWTINYVDGFDEKRTIKLNNRDELTTQISNEVNNILVEKLRPLLSEYLNDKYDEDEQLYIGNISDQINLVDVNYNLLVSNSRIYIAIIAKSSEYNKEINRILTSEIGDNINYIIFDKGSSSSYYKIQGLISDSKTITKREYTGFLEQ